MSAQSSGWKTGDGRLLPAAIGVVLCILEKVGEAAWHGSTMMRAIALGVGGLFGLLVLVVVAVFLLSYVERRRTVAFDGAVITVGGMRLRRARVALAEITNVVARGDDALEIQSREAKLQLTRRELSSSGVLQALLALPSFRQDAVVRVGESVVFAPNVPLWTKPPRVGAVYRRR